uniref:PPM-type phosphatase domain-containing protein n=1 Tax=Globodera pallida TaxID=36090 RepID=A0A183C9R4_GLOPA
MGAFLDKPKTEKTNDAGVGRDYRYVVASMQGWRIDMEDAHHEWSFFAVFDGHAGSKVAFHSAQNLLQTLLATTEFREVKKELKLNGPKITERAKSLIHDGVRRGFLELDTSLELLHGSGEKERSGTTAICAILTPDYVFFANLGDSRGLLSRRSNTIFSTEDHKPYLEKERDRIVKAGGSVMIQRVNGSLAVSRALGDFEYKSVPGLCATEQLVSPEPDVYIVPRDKDDDEFLILACDGIYDVLANEELCSLIRSRLSVTEDHKVASNHVLDVCLSKGSRDNMTMIVVIFDAAPKVDAKLVELEQIWLTKIEKRVREIEDADTLTMMLKDEGFDECSSPSLSSGIHLARPLIDRLIFEKERDGLYSDSSKDLAPELRRKSDEKSVPEMTDMETQKCCRILITKLNGLALRFSNLKTGPLTLLVQHQPRSLNCP